MAPSITDMVPLQDMALKPLLPLPPMPLEQAHGLPLQVPLLPSAQVLTHGYVHGHVHQHKDHMHIHGHFHNHDHTKDDLLGTLQAEAPFPCKELDTSLDLCDDIFCDELDDCYFYDCDRHDGGVAEPVDATDAECCHGPACLSDPAPGVCVDSECMKNDHHGNSLCESQRPRLPIFENLIQNVQRNIENYSTDIFSGDIAGPAAKRARLDSNSHLQIHFPHHCHQDVKPVEKIDSEQNSHTSHQSCFHARIPAAMQGNSFLVDDQGKLQSDYDFFMHFNNFNQLLPDQLAGLLAPKIKRPSEPLQPSYPCKWEKCSRPVDNSSLVDHLLQTHVNNEYHYSNPVGTVPEYECEWNDCNFVDADLKLFLDHLNTHKLDNTESSPRSDIKIASPLLTPRSIESTVDTPLKMEKAEKGDPLPGRDGFNITEMKIMPKKSCVAKPKDGIFTCLWQTGQTETGEPILCNAQLHSDGELQEHLKCDHIGSGKSIYHCCWHGCERNGGKPFVQRQKLFRHIHVHTGHKPCRCDECGALFAVPAMLKQHKRIHSGEKPYVCNVCNKAFSSSSSLALHHRVHSGKRPLACPWPGCDKHFGESSNLSKHLRVHQAKHTCEVCNADLPCKKLLRKHRKTHDL